jgi:very-short-patch-repair endonuclease
MAPGQPVDTVAKWMHQADVERVLDLREVWAAIERLRQHRGSRVVEAALAVEVAPTRSGLEDLYLEIVRSAGLPEPDVNRWLWSGETLEEVDFCWAELGVIVEVDSVKYHSSAWRKRRDREKAQRFRAVGWLVWRAPELAITLDPAGVAAKTRHLTEHGRSNAADSRISSPTA